MKRFYSRRIILSLIIILESIFIFSSCSGYLPMEFLVKEKTAAGAYKTAVSHSRYKKRDVYRIGINYKYSEAHECFEEYETSILFEMKDNPLHDSINYVFCRIGEEKAETLDAVWATPMGATPISFTQPDIEKIIQYLIQGDEKNGGVVDLATLKNKTVFVMQENNYRKRWVVQLLVEENMKSNIMFDSTNEHCNDPAYPTSYYYLDYEEYLLKSNFS